ncbi:MAG TPA: hypothetical protein VMN78_10485 [Longimicrobiales bacterium]|nr:hypothetical protein [Longimicrobiales bacterium]
MMNRVWFVGAFMLVGCVGGGEAAREVAPVPLPRIALAEVGDSVMYFEQTTAFTSIERPSDTLRVRSRHDAVVHVVRTAPDTLEGFYEHLRVRFEGGSQTQTLDTDALLGVRYVLHDDDGRIETVSAPELPAGIRQLSDLRRQFEDFFLRLPDRPLDIGVEWVDTVYMNATTDGGGSAARLAVTRFHVRGDTVVEDVAARLVVYETGIESTTRSAPTTQGTLTSSLVGVEHGTFVYAPDREVMLRRFRTGELEGELVVEGNLETLRLPQIYRYDSRIELLPPVVPGGDREEDAEPAEVPAIP